jgi:tetratricopeptide (TPR) repeat protein
MGWVWPASELVVDGPAGVLNPISNSAAQVGKFHDAAINAGLLSLIMVTLGASFLCTVQMNSGVWSTLSSVFVFRPALAEQTSYGMLWMFVGVFLFTALLLQLAQDALAGRKPNWAGIFISLGSALLISGLAWVIRASQLAGIAQAMVRQEDMVTISAGLPALLMGSLFVIFVIGLGLALVLGQLPAGRTGTTFSLTWLAGAGVAGVLLLTGVLLNAMCLRPLQSNSLFVQVLRLSGAHDYANALKIYDQVLPLAPTEIYHLRYAATLYGDAINSSSDPVQKERYFQAGLKPVQQAQALEPLSIDNTIALARFYRQGADFTADPALKNLRFFSANRNYAHALNVKPGRIDYWLEWAELQALTGDIQGAFEKVDRALAVDRTYAPTYQFLGDLYSVYADNLSVPAARADSLTRALQAYQNQAELLASQKANAAMAFFNVGKTYESMQKYSEAREAYRHSAELNLAENQWRVYKRIADVSALLKDPAGQRQFLQKALEAAPPAEKPALQSEINALAP